MMKCGPNKQAVQDFLKLTEFSDDVKVAADLVKAEEKVTTLQERKNRLDENERKAKEYLEILDSDEYKQVLEQMKRNKRYI